MKGIIIRSIILVLGLLSFGLLLELNIQKGEEIQRLNDKLKVYDMHNKRQSGNLTTSSCDTIAKIDTVISDKYFLNTFHDTIYYPVYLYSSSTELIKIEPLQQVESISENNLKTQKREKIIREIKLNMDSIYEFNIYLFCSFYCANAYNFSNYISFKKALENPEFDDFAKFNHTRKFINIHVSKFPKFERQLFDNINTCMALIVKSLNPTKKRPIGIDKEVILNQLDLYITYLELLNQSNYNQQNVRYFSKVTYLPNENLEYYRKLLNKLEKIVQSYN